MKAKLLFSMILIAATLSGCSQFSKNHFYEKSFGIDLNEYVGNYETSYTDGILEVYDVSSADDLYKEFFGKYVVQQSTSTLFGYGFKTYYATESSPISYVLVSSSNQMPYNKYVLYLPQKRTMVFIYPDAVGG